MKEGDGKRDSMRCLAIIPARGGSKSIPHKNVHPLLGKPLLAYSIEHAKGSPSIQRVIVSTDDAEIGAVARQYGAEVVQRPADISGDTASSESALRHVLDHLRQSEGYEPDLVVFIQATSPLRQPDDIEKAIQTLVKEKADSLFSACPLRGKIWRREQGRLNSFSYDYRNRQRRQDMPEELMENGSFFLFKPWVLLRENNRLGGVISVHFMSELDSFEVDEPADVPVIENLLRLRAAVDETRSGEAVPPSIRAPNAVPPSIRAPNAVRGVNCARTAPSLPAAAASVPGSVGPDSSEPGSKQSPERSEWGDCCYAGIRNNHPVTPGRGGLRSGLCWVDGRGGLRSGLCWVNGQEHRCVPGSVGFTTAPPMERLTAIRLLVFDFDGVMTDNRVLVDQDGGEAVLCNRGDGLGLARLRKQGTPELLVLSTEENPVVTARCRKLGLTCVQGVGDKLQTLQELGRQKGLSAAEIAFVGNDINDLACLQWVGLPIAVADALSDVLHVARGVTQNRGGHGAVREVCDWFLALPAPPT